MNVTMQQPFQYPFYMDRSRPPVSIPWSSTPFPSTFIYPQQRDLLPRNLVPPTSSFSNARYHHLKQSSRHSNRRSNRHSSYHDPIATYQYRPSKTKSVSDFGQLSQSNSAHLLKANSWHTMANPRPSNLSVSYANEMNLNPKSRRRRSPRKRKTVPPQRPLSLSSSPKRKASFRKYRKQVIQLPERGVIRISTLDEMPIANPRVEHRRNSINMDRISTKGSISNSSQRRIKPKEKTKGDTRSIRSIRSSNNDDNEATRIDADTQSSSSNYSFSSLQHRLNGSLRNDPLISAAMEDYREHQRSSSPTITLTSRHRDLSRDSLRSNPASHASSSSSDKNSQSSFTSLERSEIRQLIKTIKTKDTKSVNTSLHSSPLPLPTPSEESISINSPSPVPTTKPRKSSLTEELDREFDKLRALDPDQEINCVTPSSICKRKKTLEKPASSFPPLPTFDELLRQVQLRPVDKPTRPVYVKKEKSVDDHYENPLLSVPVPVPRSSPIPVEEIKIEEPKHEYAIPNKRSLARVSHFQPSRNFKFIQPIPSIRRPSKRSSRSLSMLNWLQNNLTNQFPTTFQPDPIIDHPIEYATANVVKENIYASNIDVYSTLPTIDKIDYDQSLQIHLDNQTILTDDFYSDFQTIQTTNSSTILDDFSHLFTRKHKLHKKSHRCSIM